MARKQRKLECCRDPRIEPTPETVAKLELDRIDELFRAGRLRFEHVQASAEIREVYGYWREALGCTSGAFSGVPGSGFPDPVGNMPDRIERAWRQHYAPWAAEQGPDAATVLHIVVENWWPKPRALRRHTLRLVQHRLWRYAQIAGWVNWYSMKTGT